MGAETGHSFISMSVGGLLTALFARRGFTAAAGQEGERLGALLVDLAQMDGDFALMAAG